MRNITLLSLVLVLILLTGCSIAGNSAKLGGTSWVLVSYGGVSPIAGTQLTLRFEGGAMGGSACNSFGGDYQISGNKLKVGMMNSTMMYCTDEGVMDQETAYVAMLGDAQSFELQDGRLIIFTSQGEELVFVPAP